MRLLTYLAFTLLSVVIQFCVMDFIQGNIGNDDSAIYLNATIKNNKNSIGILKNYDQEDHALYYRLKKSEPYDEYSDSFNEKSSSLRNPLPKEDDSTSTTELSLTVYDLIYDEDNASMTYGSTTETVFTSTELDNVTEITLFETTSTTIKPSIPKPKVRIQDKCFCNLLYKQCDLDCCCDIECTDEEKNLFGRCKDPTLNIKKEYWEQDLKCDAGTKGFNSLFCIAKTNLPEKRIILKEEASEEVIHDAFLWHDYYTKDDLPDFNRNIYKNGDPIWVMRNKSVAHLDLPACVANNYCSARRTLKFLNDEEIHCHVKFKELEMFLLLKTVEESKVISISNNSLNNTVMNCSSFYCINWTIIYCDDLDCVSYNTSLHEPICTDSWCSNVGIRIEYIFHIFDTKIVTAIIKIYGQKVSTSVQYIKQEIRVQFLIGNATLSGPVKLSGNPGYVVGLPMIVSFAKSNHSDNFFNKSNENDLQLPSNNGGICFKSSITRKVLEFGYNKRLTCKIVFRSKPTSNGTEACASIQGLIDKMLSVDRKIYVSPSGNPDTVNDDKWIPIELKSGIIYGEYHLKQSILHCFNLRTRVAFVFTYADFSDTEIEENKLLSAKLLGFAKNVTFSTDDLTTLVTVDINFISANKMMRYDVAGPPHFNLNLPRNFFLPSPSNECNAYGDNINLITYLCIYVTFLTK